MNVRPTPAERHVDDAALTIARHLMAGRGDVALSLKEAAAVLGVLPQDLDLALWRSIGSKR